MSHLATVQEIYEAFGRGDVPGRVASLRHYVDTAKHIEAHSV